MTGTISRLALEEVLVSQGLVARDALARVSHDPSSGRSLVDDVVRAGLLTEEQIAFAVSEELSYPFVTPTPSSIDPALVRCVPVDVLRRHRALPLLCADGIVDVAFADPTSSRAISAVAGALGSRIRPAVATTAAIRAVLRHVFGAPPSPGAPDESRGHSAGDAAPAGSVLADGMGVAADWAETSGALRLHSTLLDAVERGVQAIQVTPRGASGTLSRRVGGRWEVVEELAPGERSAFVARLAALVGAPPAAEGAVRRAALSTRVGGRPVRLAASFVPVAPSTPGSASGPSATTDGLVVTVTIHPVGALAEPPPQGLTRHDVDALVGWLREGDGVIALNDADEDAALALVERLLVDLPDGARAVVVARTGTPAVAGSTNLSAHDARRLASGPADGSLASAVESAVRCLPDVLVVVPGPGAAPPREAFLAARDARRVIVVGAWRDADETRRAWSSLALPAGCVAAAARGYLSLERGGDGRPHAAFVRESGASGRGDASGPGRSVL